VPDPVPATGNKLVPKRQRHTRGRRPARTERQIQPKPRSACSSKSWRSRVTSVRGHRSRLLLSGKPGAPSHFNRHEGSSS